MNELRSLLRAAAASVPAIALLLLLCTTEGASAQSGPAPPSGLAVADTGWDGGEKIDLEWTISPDDTGTPTAALAGYNIYASMTKAEIEKNQSDEQKKAVGKAMLDATTAILGLGWEKKAREIVPTLAPDVLARVRAARDAARSQAIADAEAKAAAATGVQFRFVDTVLAGATEYTVSKLHSTESYSFKIEAYDGSARKSTPVVSAAPISPVGQWWDGTRFFLSMITLLFCGSVVYWINHARRGKPVKVRKIAGLEAVDEAVGRATEMGRSCLYIPGIQDINEIQTIASMTILARVAKTAAEYDAKVEVPTARSLVMTTARETVQAAYLAAGRPDAYNQDLIYYVTDEQFGFVAYLSGMMVREKPAACFYMGAFFAESLILAETGNSIGAIQVAGTAMPAQLPFFVAACDYTLIGEEFFAASAYLSGSAEELGSLKGQDVGKVIVAVLLLVGVGLATLATMTDSTAIGGWVEFLKNTVLT